MANERHLAVIREGAAAWNEWRRRSPGVVPDLIEASLPGADLAGADLRVALLLKADLSSANLEGAQLHKAILGSANLTGAKLAGADLERAECHDAMLADADLSGASLDYGIFIGANLQRATFVAASLGHALFRGADLREADLKGSSHAETDFTEADLSGADMSDTFAGPVLFNRARLSGANLRSTVLNGASFRGALLDEANLRGADLTSADLEGANLSGADLRKADLNKARLVATNLRKANISGCSIFAVSTWGVKLEDAKQVDLRITDMGEPLIAVDDLEIAQFIYQLLHNRKLRDVIAGVSSSIVLILGRFTSDRKPALDAIRKAVRRYDYTPVLFDCEPLASRDIAETLIALARMTRFIIADVTDASAVLNELRVVVPDLPTIPVQPLLLSGAKEDRILQRLKRHSSFLPLHRYRDVESLPGLITESVIGQVEAAARELQER
jgi:uncharacterized protein YjbI with pentapeptide repeats